LRKFLTALSEEEIEALKKTHPKKKILRIIFLVVGVSIMLLGLLFLTIGYDFKIELMGINFSFAIDIIIIIIGMILASKFFIAPYYIRENSITIKNLRNMRELVEFFIKFNSLALTRLIVAILLIIAGIISLEIFGTGVGHELEYGSAVFLGGPSWFYVTGLPALGFGFGLLLYFFLSIFRGIFSKSKNFYFFYEIRPGFPWLTEIPIKDVEAFRYQNNHLGPKLTWIVVFMPFIVMQLMTAIPLFWAERAGPEHILSWTFVIISIIEIISVIILVFFYQEYYEIATNTKLYEMWFAPVKFKNKEKFHEEFHKLLSFGNVESFKERELGELRGEIFKNVKDKHSNYYRLILGSILVLLSIIMLTQMLFFGPLVWWVMIIYGFILIVEAVTQDFSKKGSELFFYDESTRVFKSYRKFWKKFQYIEAKNVKDIKVTYRLRSLDFFDVASITWLTMILIIQMGLGWYISDSLSLILYDLISTLVGILIIIMLFIYLCFPINVVEFKTSTIKYQIPLSIQASKKNFIENIKQKITTFKETFKDNELRRVFLIRTRIFGLIILGSIVFLIIYRFFIF